ncbi:hypothetical protein BRAS3843_520219 [Bradyrhizobium sp. STM 3843]|nr:hypothetical protein BRAS3843_520219 [Bradyrhizobium sp. STM 3843]
MQAFNLILSIPWSIQPHYFERSFPLMSDLRKEASTWHIAVSLRARKLPKVRSIGTAARYISVTNDRTTRQRRLIPPQGRSPGRTIVVVLIQINTSGPKAA